MLNSDCSGCAQARNDLHYADQNQARLNSKIVDLSKTIDSLREGLLLEVKKTEAANLQVSEAYNLLLQAKAWIGVDPNAKEAKEMSDVEKRVARFLELHSAEKKGG